MVLIVLIQNIIPFFCYHTCHLHHTNAPAFELGIISVRSINITFPTEASHLARICYRTGTKLVPALHVPNDKKAGNLQVHRLCLLTQRQQVIVQFTGVLGMNKRRQNGSKDVVQPCIFQMLVHLLLFFLRELQT